MRRKTTCGPGAASAGLRHRLSQALGLHFQYARDQNEYAFAAGAPFVNQTIDAGVDYGDTLSFARRTALSFTTSTAATHYLGETHYRAERLGAAHPWIRAHVELLGRLQPRHGVQNRIPRAPAQRFDRCGPGGSDLVAGEVVNGRRVYERDDRLWLGESDRFHTYSATSRLDFALNRTLAIFGQYGHYHYEVPPGSSTLDLVPRFSRQTVVIGLSVYLPLIHDVRAPKEP